MYLLEIRHINLHYFYNFRNIIGMDRFVTSDPADVARLKSGDSCTRVPRLVMQASAAASDSAVVDCPSGKPSKTKSKSVPERQSLSLAFLGKHHHEFPWLHLPKAKTNAMTLYLQEGRLVCTVCRTDLKPTKKEHLVHHHETKHVAHQDIASALDYMDSATRAMYVAADLRLAGLLPNGFDTLREVEFATMAGALADAVPERHIVTAHVAKFNAKLRAEICASMADKPVILVIDESSSTLDSMRSEPAVMATVIINLEDASCALLDVTAMKYPDAAAVAKYIQNVLSSAGIHPTRVVGFMADNVSYMTAAADILREVPGYDTWQRFRCIAHILNLLVKQLLPACGPVEPVLRALSALWSGGSLQVKKALQPVLGSAVTKGNDTRWAHFMEGVEHMMGDMEGEPRWFATAAALSAVDASKMSATAQSLLEQMQQTRVIVGFAVAHALLAEVPDMLRELQGHPISLKCMLTVHNFFMTLRSPHSIESAVDNALLGAVAQLEGTLEEHCISLPARSCYGGGVLDSLAVAALKDSLGKALHTCRDIVARNYLKGMARLVKQKAITYDSVACDWPSLAKSALKHLEPLVFRHVVSASQYSAVLRSLPVRLTDGLHADDGDDGLMPASGALAVYFTRMQAIPLSSAAVERVFSVMTRLLSDKLRSRMASDTLLGDIFLMANRDRAKLLLRAAASTASLNAGMTVQSEGKRLVYTRAGSKRQRAAK